MREKNLKIHSFKVSQSVNTIFAKMRPLISLDDYEIQAREVLPKNALDYYRSGAGDEQTLGWNRTDFKNFRIRPRFLRDVSARDSSVNILGSKLSFPCGISPTAMQRMANEHGEIANAKGNIKS